MDNDFDPIAYINEPRWHSMSLGLGRIEELLHGLGDPHKSLCFVHVAGTNGKGSTCSYLAQILQEAGIKVGLFTSPYLIKFEERIRVDGKNIPYDDLVRVTKRVRTVAEEMAEHPTEFELMTAVAFLYFKQCKVNIVVAEVGLGGRLDSTNVIERPELSIITSIGLDHVAVLGSTISQIAVEKAGIIKPGVPVLSWPQEPDALDRVKRAAKEAGSRLYMPDLSELLVPPVYAGSTGLVRPFYYKDAAFETELLGSYQPSNAVMAIEAARILRGLGWDIDEGDIWCGIAHAQWAGRFQLLSSKPDFVVDGGHNVQGAEALACSLASVFPEKKAVLVVGVLADKQHRAMLEKVLPQACSVLTITPPSPRALSAEELAAEVKDVAAELEVEELPVAAADDIESALARAFTLAGEDGLVVAFGSLYSVGEIMAAHAALRL
ncbi:MAG: folylpolyglutamate synthase/dihydrofolate synthase family protein [Coriobacteriia bacterium]|nr:folylpolyglutamate synthase/dihydrofolate synthase family protein [Coriobacteriia bacterium]